MRRAHRKRAALGLALALSAGALLLSGCGSAMQTEREAEDAAGTTKREAMSMTLEEQYARAGERYTELNERFAELQREFFEDEWQDGSVSSEVVPRQGYVLGGALNGDDRENSYYFTMTRWYLTDEELKPLLRMVAESWKARGWEVGEEASPNGRIRIVATTEERYWFAADEARGQLELSAHSPVYWGDQFALLEAIADRRDAENEAGAPWDTTDRDEKGHAYRLPGDYRPFPAWEAVDDG